MNNIYLYLFFTLTLGLQYICSYTLLFLLFHIVSILLLYKRYYFGVGGGTETLMEIFARHSSEYYCSVVKVYDDGISNIREILEVRRKTN
jgi:hypothetical protein